MSLPFYMNLYIFSILLILLFFCNFEFQTKTFIFYFFILLTPIFIIAIKRKFKIEFFQMFLNFCIIIFLFIAIWFSILGFQQKTSSFGILEKIHFYIGTIHLCLIPFYMSVVLKFLKYILKKQNNLLNFILNIIIIIGFKFSALFFLVLYFLITK